MSFLSGKSANDPVVKLKIVGLPTEKEYNALPWGRRIEHRHAIEAFKKDSKKSWLSQKGTTLSSALKKEIAASGAKEWYCSVNCGPLVRDDSFEFWWR